MLNSNQEQKEFDERVNRVDCGLTIALKYNQGSLRSKLSLSLKSDESGHSTTNISMLSNDEKIAISNYKKHANKLPRFTSLTGFVLPDFSCSRLAGSGEGYDALQKYLKVAKKYMKCLQTAAASRESHYKLFIQGKRTEDPGHRYWRVGLNQLSVDAKEKVARWAAVKEAMFTKFVRARDQVLARSSCIKQENLIYANVADRK